MATFLNCVSYEFNKIKARKKYSVILFLEILVVIMFGIVTTFTWNILDIEFKINLPNLYFTILPLFAMIILPITIFMLVSDTISLEFENNTIKNIFLRPVSRFTIYLAKNVAICLYIFINLMVVYLAAFVVKMVASFSFYAAFDGLIAYIVTIIPMFTFIIFSSFVACKINSSSMTMFLLLIVYLFLTGISTYSSKAYSVLFTNYLGYYKHFIGSVLPIRYILNTTFLLFANTLIFFILGFLVFDKRDV